ASPVLGRDVAGLTPGAAVVVDQSAALFPLPHLADLPPGDYIVQAVLDTNRDLKSPNSPGNLYSRPRELALDPARGGTVKLDLTGRWRPGGIPRRGEPFRFFKPPRPW